MNPRSLALAVLVPLLAAAAAAQDPLVQQAASRITRVEQAEAKLQAGDQKTANQLLADLAWAQKRLNGVVQKQADWQAAADRLAAVQQKITAKASAGKPPAAEGAPTYDPAKLAQLDKEVGHAVANFGMLSRKHLQDPFRVGTCEKEIANFERRLAEFPADDAEVQKVAAKFDGYRTKFTSTMQQLAKDQAASGDVQKHLEQVRAKYKDDAVPGELSYPYSEEQLRAWAADIVRLRDTDIPQDLAFLGEAAQNAAVDQQAVSSLTHWLRDLRDRTIATSLFKVADRLRGELKHGLDYAQWILDTDPGDKNQVSNRILGKGRFDENMTRLRELRHAVAMQTLHDELIGGGVQPERAAQAKKVDEAIAHLQKLAVVTLDAVRMPKAATDDPELAAIAAATLKQPGYGVGDWQRLVVNTEKVRHESREAWIRPGTVTTTVSYYHYVWDQFQVTTAEKVGDTVWLFANTLKRYESGDPTKKVGSWILSQRFELTPILPENVDK